MSFLKAVALLLAVVSDEGGTLHPPPEPIARSSRLRINPAEVENARRFIEAEGLDAYLARAAQRICLNLAAREKDRELFYQLCVTGWVNTCRKRYRQRGYC